MARQYTQSKDEAAAMEAEALIKLVRRTERQLRVGAEPVSSTVQLADFIEMAHFFNRLAQNLDVPIGAIMGDAFWYKG